MSRYVHDQGCGSLDFDPLCTFLLVIGLRGALVLVILAFYLKIMFMAPLLLFSTIADIGWGVMDRPPESPTFQRGRSVSALNLEMDDMRGK